MTGDIDLADVASATSAGTDRTAASGDAAHTRAIDRHITASGTDHAP